MKRYFVRYEREWAPGPMGYWVHKPTDRRGLEFERPLPRPVPGEGYPHYHVEIDGFTFEFASLDELDACASTLSSRHLPSTDKETSAWEGGAGAHWLNKLPGDVKSWRYWAKAVRYLERAREAFERGVVSGK